MRIVVVDDRPSQRDGRVLWLSRESDIVVEGLTFEQAAALGPGWKDVRVAVLDGHDRRPAQRREASAADAGILPLAPYDNFVGVRIAALIRERSGPDQTTIIMISAHARDSDVRARRIAQSGVDFVFEHYEVDIDEPTFVRAVLHPETFSPHPRTVNWAEQGYFSEPDVAAAIAAVEASPAGPMLLNDEPHSRHPEHEWTLRRLRSRTHDALHASISTGSGPRSPRASRKSWLAAQLRQALGRDLPVDPD